MRSLLAHWIARLLVLLAAAPGAGAQDATFEVGPRPDWVLEDALPPVPAGESGTAWLFFDSQVRVEGDEPTSFRREAWAVRDPLAVQEGSQVSVEFDPSYQALTLHWVRVHRDGEVLERLDRERVQLLSREGSLEEQIYLGSVSAYFVINDVRAGDVVDYAYSLRGQNPAFGGRFLDRFATESSVPLGRIRYRLLWPTDRPLGVRPDGGAPDPTMRATGERVEYLWDLTDVAAIEPEGDRPSWDDGFGWVQISEFPSWEAVALWGTELYAHGTELPAELAEEIERIRGAGTDLRGAVEAAYAFVRDEIRYYGIELGSGSYEPTPPGEVFARRFGDCKDKSLLLVSMLRELGVEADPVLVHTRRRGTIAGSLPSPWAFNHVIVRVLVEGRTHWLDPTDTWARGRLERVFVRPYGRGLVLREGERGLVAISGNTAQRSKIDVLVEIDASDPKGPATMEVVTTYAGEEAHSVRNSFAVSDKGDYTESCREYYEQVYPEIESAGIVEVEDDVVEDVLTVREAYVVPGFWIYDEEDDTHWGELNPLEIEYRIGIPEDPETRARPYATYFPTDMRHRFQVKLPPGALLFEEEPAEIIDGPGIRFVRDLAYDERASLFTVDTRLAITQEAIAPADCARHAEAAEEILGTLVMYAPGESGFDVDNLIELGLPIVLGLLGGFLLAGVALLIVWSGRRRGWDEDGELTWLTIWMRPRVVVRRALVEDDPGGGVVPAGLNGVTSFLSNASQKSIGDDLSTAQVLGLAFVAGPIAGWIGIYGASFLLVFAGRMLGGGGRFREVSTALGHASKTSGVVLLFLLAELLLLREEMFTTATPRLDDSTLVLPLLMVLGILQIAGGIWSVVVMCHALGEAHGFSAWKGLGAFALLMVGCCALAVPFAMLLVPLLVKAGG